LDLGEEHIKQLQQWLQWKSNTYYIFWGCVCSLRYSSCKRMRHFAVSGLTGCTKIVDIIS